MNAFGKDKRLLTKADFDYVFSQAQKLVTKDFLMFSRCNDKGHARLGLAIAKKKVPQAHDRNAIKRILRETFRKAKLPAVDVVVIARSGAKDKLKQDLYISAKDSWKKLS